MLVYAVSPSDKKNKRNDKKKKKKKEEKEEKRKILYPLFDRMLSNAILRIALDCILLK
jgi:hypothetical protein